MKESKNTYYQATANVIHGNDVVKTNDKLLDQTHWPEPDDQIQKHQSSIT